LPSATSENQTLSKITLDLKMKQIQFTKGCPNQCEYCYEPKEMEYYDPNIPVGEDCIRILDMNFLANPNCKTILHCLEHRNKSYELICGIDHRILLKDIEIALLMKKANFVRVRWAWDYGFSQQKIHQKVLNIFKEIGYKPEELSVFIITNWKIPYVECCRKLDLLKIWNVKVNDCCFDGGYRNTKPIHWDIQDIKRFRKMCRKHNQMVLFKIDPELKSRVTSDNYRNPQLKLRIT